MKYARQLIDLMQAHPRTDYRVGTLVRHVAGEKTDGRAAQRRAVQRVLSVLVEIGAVRRRNPACFGMPATYRWRGAVVTQRATATRGTADSERGAENRARGSRPQPAHS